MFLYNNCVIKLQSAKCPDVLAIVCYECGVLGDTVVMPWIVEEEAGAVCGVDCSCMTEAPICLRVIPRD